MNKAHNWKRILVYYLIACLFSWPFFIWRDLFPDAWSSSSVPSGLKNLGLMWGPGIAALVCFYLFKNSHHRTITFKGTSLIGGLLFYIIPYLIWIIVSLINPVKGSVEMSRFLVLIPFGFLMILGEELGWRGFLQDALRPVKEWKRWVVLGLMWEFWHFSRGLVGKEILQAVLFKISFIVVVVAFTFLIGKLTEKTKSLFVAITLHSWFNIFFEFDHINTFITGAISLVFWVILIINWKKWFTMAET